MQEFQQPVDRRRRRLLAAAGASAAAGLTLPSFAGSGWSPRTERRSALFTLGVASGDPRPRRMTLWTRLAPDPLDGGGLGDRTVPVTVEIATDPAFADVVAGGQVLARPQNGHAVNVTITGLTPATTYWYRFLALGDVSRTGRTRTFPSRLASPDRLRFALASCQNYEAGYYAAYRDMAEQALDVVVHTGDYIYEGAADPNVPAERRHAGGESVTVEDYRNRYAQYRLDADLQDAHAAFPWITTWDDHEVDNNYAGLAAEDDQGAEAFARRRAAAYQVYRESMPLAPRQQLDGGTLDLYRRLAFGDLATFHVLDTRQYRDDQPCDDRFPAFLDACPELADPTATMTGDAQEAWLYDGLARSRALWNVMAQQVMMMKWDVGAPLGVQNAFNPDAWDGYQGARQRLLDFLARERPANPVVLTGDIHSSWAADLEVDFGDPASPIVGAEFVCTSITSSFGDLNAVLAEQTLPSNPHIRFFDGLFRGYALCEVDRELWRTDFRGVQRQADPVFTVPDPALPVSTIASYGVRAGAPGVVNLG